MQFSHAILTGLFLLSAVSEMGSLSADDELTIYYEDHPPFTYPEDGGPKGVFVPATQAALAKAGFRANWRLLSFNRIKRAIAVGQDAFCVTGHSMGDDADGRQYVATPVGSFGRSGLLIREADMSKFADLTGVQALFVKTDLVGGFIRDATYAVEYQKYLPRSHDQHLMLAGTHEQLAQLVAKGRIDFVFENEMMLPIHRRINEGEAALSFVALPGMPEAREAHIVCSAAIPPAWVARIDAALSSIKKAAP